MPGNVLKKLPKDRTAGNGIDMGGFPFFTVNMKWLPATVLAEFLKEPLLGIQRVPFDLGCVRNSDISYCFHCFAPLSQPFLDATAMAISAKVCRKRLTMI
jgi:hypothetical protein